MRAGDTYDPASLVVVSSTEGSRSVVYSGDEAFESGFSLAASGTRLRGTQSDPMQEVNGVAGVGMMPFGSADMCSPVGATLGKNPGRYGAPRRNGIWHRVPWVWVGCDGPTTWRVADGVTTYTVGRLKRVYRPAVYRTIWEDQGNGDAYFSICLQWDNLKTIRQSGGRKYCKVLVREQVDRTTYRLTQRTTITKVYPAYVTP